MPASCWKYQNAHSFANKKTGIPGHHWPPLVFSIFALAAEPKAISWRFLSYIIRADEEEQKENLELPKTEGRGRLWGHRLENVEAHTIDMVQKLFFTSSCDKLEILHKFDSSSNLSYLQRLQNRSEILCLCFLDVSDKCQW